ncbi:hypothetical protein BCF74_1103 [Knoellia remsis]|uniref:Lipoprotein n=1 Tax=Knoellia remsis TaxID=407159 RepID=A0A2T0UMZ3_9MICO|nr:hypothetical protein [Knoellia remsis]PRY59266.1 hypothetical protein BCF74_1103 [Knoellia remsis]
MRGAGRATAAVLCCALLAACGSRPDEQRIWAEPQLATAPGYRVADGEPRDPELLRAARDWVDSGTVPGEGTEWEPMSRVALLDLNQAMSGMSRGLAPVAGPAAGWDYFWPRDGAFVAVALDRTGHTREASFIVDFMARLPFDKKRGFDARYEPNGTPVVDRPRGPQSDGCGWVLWAVGSLSSASLPPSTAGLRSKCLRNLLDLTWSGWQLPPPSPDYWEVAVPETTLGTVAPMIAGLRATADAADAPPAEAWAAGQAAKRLERQVFSSMGPSLQALPR